MINLKTKSLFQLFICSLLICLSFSCNNIIQDSGYLNFTLPENRNSENPDDKILYTVTLKKTNGRIVYEKSTKENSFVIDNIYPGRYELSISGEDSKYLYEGNKEIIVSQGKATPVDMILNRFEISNDVTDGNGDSGDAGESGGDSGDAGGSGDVDSGDTHVEDKVVTSYETLTTAISNAKEGETITLGGSFDITDTVNITQNITLVAKEPVTLTRAAGNKKTLFDVNDSTTLTLGSDSSAKITIDGNKDKVTNAEGTIINVPKDASLIMTNCTLQNNHRNQDGGGAIYNKGTITIKNSTIQNNFSKQNGGGIYNPGGTATLTNVTISGNITYTNGGGIAVSMSSSDVIIDGSSSITGNSSPDTSNGKGGGLFINGGSVTLKDSASISNNKKSSGSFGANLYIDQNTKGVTFNNINTQTVKFIDNTVNSETDISKL